MLRAKPFVKWAGGKRSIVDKLINLVPENYETYYEPFVGGGAMLYELQPKKAVINDYMENCYSHYSRGNYVDFSNNMILDLNYNKSTRVEILNKLKKFL